MSKRADVPGAGLTRLAPVVETAWEVVDEPDPFGGSARSVR
jgi:hypothetical protein